MKILRESTMTKLSGGTDCKHFIKGIILAPKIKSNEMRVTTLGGLEGQTGQMSLY